MNANVRSLNTQKKEERRNILPIPTTDSNTTTIKSLQMPEYSTFIWIEVIVYLSTRSETEVLHDRFNVLRYECSECKGEITCSIYMYGNGILLDWGINE